MFNPICGSGFGQAYSKWKMKTVLYLWKDGNVHGNECTFRNAKCENPDLSALNFGFCEDRKIKNKKNKKG